jgi:hypothetical protein
MKYTKIKEEYQNKLSELSEQVGLFWAFNTEQFIEGKTKYPTTGKYTSIGMGGYLPSENVTKYLAGLKTLSQWYKEAKKQVNKEEAILYELYNYECFYTGDITDAYEALSDTYTKEEVQEVYRNHRQKAQESL